MDLGLKKDFQIKKEYGFHLHQLERCTAHPQVLCSLRSRRIYPGRLETEDPQVVRINFSYRFGKFDVALFKRKNTKGEMEGMQNGMQGMQQ